MKAFIKKLLRENLNHPIYFLRWSESPRDDVKRNFSGHMQAWFDTEESAYADFNERVADGYQDEDNPPKEDPVTGMWNSDPEWGLSGYGFKDEKSFVNAMKEIKEIAWHHKDANQQRLYIFKSANYFERNGFDGEDTFRDVIDYWEIDESINFKQVVKLVKTPNNI